MLTKPMKLKFLKAEFKKELKIPKSFTKTLLDTFPKGSTLAVYAAIQFNSFVKTMFKTLEQEGYKPITSQPYRTSKKGQILGCDSHEDALNLDLEKVDGFIYIGDGYFHPNALLLAQENTKIKPVILANLVQNITEVIDKKHIDKYLKKKQANLAKFHMSTNIGVYISQKWGQEYLNSALKLKDKYKDKNFYFFVSDTFSELEIENFPFCEVFVNTACPRIGQDDIVRFKKAVINIKDIWQ